MVDPISMGLIIGQFIALVIVIIRAWNYYSKYYDLTHDESRYVVLRDLDGQMRQIGKFLSLGTENKEFKIRVLAEEETVQEWMINLGTQYSFEAISRNYAPEEGPKELMILCNFKKSDFKHQKIEPLFDIEILKLGLTRGLKMLTDKINPLYTQIEYLEEMLKEVEEQYQQEVIRHTRDHLRRFNELKEKVGELIGELYQEIINAPDYVKQYIRRTRQKYMKKLGQIGDALHITPPKTSTPASPQDAGAEQTTFKKAKASVQKTISETN